jgi:TMEM175 potassium channel family protein
MADPESSVAERGQARDLDRLVFFSDAVMAIAITLLVIDLRLPSLPPITTEAELRSALADLAPRLFSFFLSFAVIGLWWTAHHRLFGSVVRLDGRLLVLDLAFLGAIAFLPFPTSILGLTLLPTSVALYAGTNAVIGYLIVTMRTHADRQGLIDASVPRDLYRTRTLRSLIAPSVFALSIPLAYIAPVAAVWSWNLVWIATAAVRRLRGPSGPY